MFGDKEWSGLYCIVVLEYAKIEISLNSLEYLLTVLITDENANPGAKEEQCQSFD